MIDYIDLQQLIRPYLLKDGCGELLFAFGCCKLNLMLCFLLCIINFKFLLK